MLAKQRAVWTRLSLSIEDDCATWGAWQVAEVVRQLSLSGRLGAATVTVAVIKRNIERLIAKGQKDQ